VRLLREEKYVTAFRFKKTRIIVKNQRRKGASNAILRKTTAIAIEGVKEDNRIMRLNV